MKKLYNLCIMVCTMIWAGACTPEVDDVFDKPAANRINEAIAEYKEVLHSAANGWVLNYYPSTTKEFGGYTMLLRFTEEGKVEASCDLFKADKLTSSLYDITNSAGPMLTFNTYNDVIHFFSEPANAMGIGQNGTGMGGDADFLIISCTPEKVILKGKKTGNKMIMHPLPENTVWKDYLTAIKSVTNSAYPALYEVVIDGQVQYTVTQRYRNFILENADGSQINLPFHYTTEGISFGEKLALSTLQVKDLHWDQQNMQYTGDHLAIRAKELPKNYTRYKDYAGDYSFIYYDNSKQVKVTLEEELFNESYIMKGFPLDIRIRYKAATGSIGIEYQELSDNKRLLPWAINEEGYLGTTEGSGMEGYMTESTEGGKKYQTIALKDNGVWGSKTCDSFIAIDNTTGKDIFQIIFATGFIREIPVGETN